MNFIVYYQLVAPAILGAIGLVNFIVCYQLVAPAILGADFCEKTNFLESIRPRRKQVQLADGRVVPIAPRPLACAPNAPPFPAEREYWKDTGRPTPNLRVSRAATVEHYSHSWVLVTVGRAGLVVLPRLEE